MSITKNSLFTKPVKKNSLTFSSSCLIFSPLEKANLFQECLRQLCGHETLKGVNVNKLRKEGCMSMKAFKLLVVGAVSMTVMGLASTSLAGGEGGQTFKAKKCADCHATSGPSKIASIEEWEKKKGPDLWFAGSKFNAEWLEKRVGARPPT